MPVDTLPLFPLNTVLFPGGELQLRIFEPRYLDLVRQCTREGSCFGVCLIVRGGEAGEPAVPAVHGTTARIVDFYSLSEGLLGISVCGEQRFRVEHTRVHDNGLIVAEVDWLPEPTGMSVPTEHGLLASLLERLIEHIGGPYAKVDKNRYDDAAWVGYRLSEMLPFQDAQRQELLQMIEPYERLARITELLPKIQRG